MAYVTNFFAVAFILLSGGMFFAYYRTRHFGLFIMAMTYASSGVLALALPHWWPLVTGFVVAWMLKMIGLEPKAEVQEDEGTANEEAKSGKVGPSGDRGREESL